MKISYAEIRFKNKKIGSFIRHPDGRIQGEPFPSESDAYAFDKALYLLEYFLCDLSYGEQQDILNQFGLD